MWMPTLCRKKDIPYIIVKSKSRLGQVVHKKTATVLALTDVAPKDEQNFELIRQKARDQFLGRYNALMTTYGGGILGRKHNDIEAKKEQAKKKEAERQKRAAAAAKSGK